MKNEDRKTVEGFAGGIATATLLGCALSPITPFTLWQSALLSLTVTVLGFLALPVIWFAFFRGKGEDR